ncbi:MAG: hypothetical protein Q9194_006745 [Teloschistes cf. exilis]
MNRFSGRACSSQAFLFPGFTPTDSGEGLRVEFLPNPYSYNLDDSDSPGLSIPVTMIYLAVLVATLAASSHAKGLFAEQDVLDNGIDPERYKAACPDYRHYAMMPQYSPPYLQFLDTMPMLILRPVVLSVRVLSLFPINAPRPIAGRSRRPWLKRS